MFTEAIDTLAQFNTDSLSHISTDHSALIDSLANTQKALVDAQLTITKLDQTVQTISLSVNNIWMMLATALVFIMHLGFATLESGLTQVKNTTNVLFKNTIIPGIGLLTFALCGASLMFPGFVEGGNGLIGFAGIGIHIPTNFFGANLTELTFFLFQGMFAATCATIVSGAVAERIKLSAFLIFTLFFVALVYPVIGSWKWGLGWLHTLGFYDFAGSTLVHTVGGMAALAGVILLGPRITKYENGKIMPIPGHNMSSAVIGTFMLWLGWFGFNGGSVLSADPSQVSKVLVTTCLAASAGGIAAAFTIYFVGKNFDLSMSLNGILAGLVAITAGADVVGIIDSVLIGVVAGILVVLSVLMFDRLRLDDPVGALSVHMVNGIWGTLAVGIFGSKAGMAQILSQLVGILACGTAAFALSFAIFGILKLTIGIRVSKEEEIYGLDYSEHGGEAYPNFVPK